MSIVWCGRVGLLFVFLAGGQWPAVKERKCIRRTISSWTRGMPPVRRINLSALKRRESGSSAKANTECVSEDLQTNTAVKRTTHRNAVNENLTCQSPAEKAQEVTATTFDKTCRQQWEMIEKNASGDGCEEQKCLQDDFYDVPCEELAKSLLGKILVRKLSNGHILKGRIVETECYLGEEDKASHSYKGKMTERNAPMFMKPGTIYVYFTYGMYYCFNISCKGPGAAVLIRALEPLEGLDLMRSLRARGVSKSTANSDDGGDQGGGGATSRREKTFKPHELCNGPAKLCIAMAIDKDSCNKKDLTTWPGLSVHAVAGDDEAQAQAPVVTTKRVGIESAGREWADMPLRFYLLGNASVSKRDRQRERVLQQRP